MTRFRKNYGPLLAIGVLALAAALLPLAVGAIVVAHVLLVRKHGIVPPLEAIDTELAEAPAEVTS